MSRLSEYNPRTGIVFDEWDDLINKIMGEDAGGTAAPKPDQVISSKTVDGVTYKLYKRPDGSNYTLNTNTLETAEGGFPTAAPKAAAAPKVSTAGGASASGAAPAAPAAAKVVPPKGAISQDMLSQGGAQFPAAGVAIMNGYEYRQLTDGSWAVGSKIAAPKAAPMSPALVKANQALQVGQTRLAASNQANPASNVVLGREQPAGGGGDFGFTGQTWDGQPFIDDQGRGPGQRYFAQPSENYAMVNGRKVVSSYNIPQADGQGTMTVPNSPTYLGMRLGPYGVKVTPQPESQANPGGQSAAGEKYFNMLQEFDARRNELMAPKEQGGWGLTPLQAQTFFDQGMPVGNKNMSYDSANYDESGRGFSTSTKGVRGRGPAAFDPMDLIGGYLDPRAIDPYAYIDDPSVPMANGGEMLVDEPAYVVGRRSGDIMAEIGEPTPQFPGGQQEMMDVGPNGFDVTPLRQPQTRPTMADVVKQNPFARTGGQVTGAFGMKHMADGGSVTVRPHTSAYSNRASDNEFSVNRAMSTGPIGQRGRQVFDPSGDVIGVRGHSGLFAIMAQKRDEERAARVAQQHFDDEIARQKMARQKQIEAPYYGMAGLPPEQGVDISQSFLDATDQRYGDINVPSGFFKWPLMLGKGNQSNFAPAAQMAGTTLEMARNALGPNGTKPALGSSTNGRGGGGLTSPSERAMFQMFGRNAMPGRAG